MGMLSRVWHGAGGANLLRGQIGSRAREIVRRGTGLDRGLMVTVPNSGRNWLYRWRRKLATAAIGVLLAVIGYHALFGANGLMIYEQKRRVSAELDRQLKAL